MKSPYSIFVSRVLLFISFSCLSAKAAEPSVLSRGVDPARLNQAIGERLERVPEFKTLQEKASEMGLRAWLLGGTAAGFLHYTRWDLLREAGDTSLISARFDYSFANIYRYNQDFDLVIDGTPKQAEELESWIRSKLGGDVKWEVRCLRYDRDTKARLIDNPDILNQHVDSNSIGLIEVTKPKKNEPRIRDYRDFDGKNSTFLSDAAKSENRFIQSEKHRETKRFKDGDNPEIFSVILYLKKAFQYGLTIPESDVEILKGLIKKFSATELKPNGYAFHWFVSNATKMLVNAIDKDEAWRMLDLLGFRKKLADFPDSTLSELAGREPLRSDPLGKKGKTARELGLKDVAHATRDYFVVEDLTWNPTGKVNGLISRKNQKGEAASLGNGFYVQIGDVGQGREEYSVQIEIDPEARENIDFIRRGQELLIINGSAIRLRESAFSQSATEFFRVLASRKNTKYPEGTSEDAVLSRWRRKISHELSGLLNIALEQAGKKEFNYDFFNEWFATPGSSRYPEVFEKILATSKRSKNVNPLIFLSGVVFKQLQFNGWQKQFDDLLDIAEKVGGKEVLGKVAGVAALESFRLKTEEAWKPQLQRVIQIGAREDDPYLYQNLANHFFSEPQSVAFESELIQVIRNAEKRLPEDPYRTERFIFQDLVNSVFLKSHGPKFARALVELVQLTNEHELGALESNLRHVFTRLEWKDHPDLKSMLNEEPVTLENLKKHLRVNRMSARSKCPYRELMPITQ